jgi:hypothetical protein
MAELVVAPPPADPVPRSRAAVRQTWLDRLARFPSAGLSVPEFCAREAVSVPSFYSWKRRLTAPANGNTAPPDAGGQRGPRLLPVALSAAGPPAEVVLPSGAVLRLPLGCDPAWVRALVAALGDAPC